MVRAASFVDAIRNLGQAVSMFEYELTYRVDLIFHRFQICRPEVDCAVCYEIDNHGIHNPAQFRSYACPKCGWGPPLDDPYKIVGYRHEVIDGPHPYEAERKDGEYPILGTPHYNYSTSMEFGGEAFDWDETHCCPFHGEFTFMNGNM